MEVKVIFHDDDIKCTLVLPDGKEQDFIQVSAMLNFCSEQGWTPVVAQ